MKKTTKIGLTSTNHPESLSSHRSLSRTHSRDVPAPNGPSSLHRQALNLYLLHRIVRGRGTKLQAAAALVLLRHPAQPVRLAVARGGRSHLTLEALQPAHLGLARAKLWREVSKADPGCQGRDPASHRHSWSDETRAQVRRMLFGGADRDQRRLVLPN